MEDQKSTYETTKRDLYIGMLPVTPAKKLLRFCNLIIDHLGILILSAIVGVLAVLIGGNEAIEVLERVPDIVFGITVWFAYYFFFEVWLGRTPGKLVTGTKVVDENGENPDAKQILLRSLCRFIPFEAFSFLGETGRGLHDSIPKTYVVKCI